MTDKAVSFDETNDRTWSLSACKRADQIEVERAFLTPPAFSGVDLRAKLLVESRRGACKFIGFKRLEKVRYRFASRNRILSERSFKVTLHLRRIDRFVLYDRPDSVFGVLGRDRPTAEVDLELVTETLFLGRFA